MLLEGFEGESMVRKPRTHYPGAFYHVMLRGNAKPFFMISSHRTYFSSDKVSRRLCVDPALKLFGQAQESARIKYRHFMGSH